MDINSSFSSLVNCPSDFCNKIKYYFTQKKLGMLCMITLYVMYV